MSVRCLRTDRHSVLRVFLTLNQTLILCYSILLCSTLHLLKTKTYRHIYSLFSFVLLNPTKFTGITENLQLYGHQTVHTWLCIPETWPQSLLFPTHSTHLFPSVSTSPTKAYVCAPCPAQESSLGPETGSYKEELLWCLWDVSNWNIFLKRKIKIVFSWMVTKRILTIWVFCPNPKIFHSLSQSGVKNYISGYLRICVHYMIVYSSLKK